MLGLFHCVGYTDRAGLASREQAMALNTTKTQTKVSVADEQLIIDHLVVENSDVVTYFGNIAEEDLASELERAILIGVKCLERAQASQDIDFVRKEVESMITTMKAAVDKLPAQTVKDLEGKLGTEQGQILHPLKQQIDVVRSAITVQLGEVEELVTSKLDVTNSESTMAVAMAKLKQLLNPEDVNSIQKQVEVIVQELASPDGQLPKSVKAVIDQALAPLTEKLEKLELNLTKEAGKQEGIEEVVQSTTLKGAAFEEDLAERILPWCQPYGTQPDLVGGDKKPGDIVIEFHSDGPLGLEFNIVLSAKDDQNARAQRRIAGDLDKAMQERGAQFGVFVGKSQATLGKGLGDFAEGECPSGGWIACTIENVVLALRLAVIRYRLAVTRTSLDTIETSQVLSQIAAIRTSLQKIATIKSDKTKAMTALNSIESGASTLQTEIIGYLDAIEAAIGPATAKAEDSDDGK